MPAAAACCPPPPAATHGARGGEQQQDTIHPTHMAARRAGRGMHACSRSQPRLHPPPLRAAAAARTTLPPRAPHPGRPLRLPRPKQRPPAGVYRKHQQQIHGGARERYPQEGPHAERGAVGEERDGGRKDHVPALSLSWRRNRGFSVGRVGGCTWVGGGYSCVRAPGGGGHLDGGLHRLRRRHVAREERHRVGEACGECGRGSDSHARSERPRVRAEPRQRQQQLLLRGKRERRCALTGAEAEAREHRGDAQPARGGDRERHKRACGGGENEREYEI